MCGVQNTKRQRKDSFDVKESKHLIDEMNLTANDVLGFSGGEPTLYKGFRELIIYARKKYSPRIIVLSNGRLLSSNKFIETLRDIGIERFIIPIFSDIEKTHDYITQVPGSFKQTYQGLCNLEKARMPYSIKFIAMRPNYLDMANVYEMKRQYFKNARFIISGYQLMGEAVTNKREVGVGHSVVSPAIEETLDRAEEHGEFIPVFMFPMCLLDPYYWKYYGVGAFNEVVVAPDQKDVILNSKLNYDKKPAKCSGCVLSKRCTWAWKNYLSFFGDRELVPIKGVA